MKVRGVILAGGKGSRLGDLTRVVNKQLLPVAHQPLVFYPLKKLVYAGITDIMVVTGTEHMGALVSLLGSGKEFDCSITYRVQDQAGGIAQAIGLAEQFAKDCHTVALLGDNVFYDSLDDLLVTCGLFPDNAAIVLKEVDDPRRFGVASFDEAGKLTAITEKPALPASDFAVTGVYAYPPDVYDMIRKLQPSSRGELEVTDLNNLYLKQDRLSHCFMSGFWIDAGTPAALATATQLVYKNGVKF